MTHITATIVGRNSEAESADLRDVLKRLGNNGVLAHVYDRNGRLLEERVWCVPGYRSWRPWEMNER